MSTLALALLIFVAVAACTFWIASDLYGHGSPWARDVCGLSRALCDHPLWAPSRPPLPRSSTSSCAGFGSKTSGPVGAVA
jgi:hypothetical protein